MYMRMLFFIACCFTRVVMSSDACCDYISGLRGGCKLKEEYRCCFKHENGNCFDQREHWAYFSCLQVATWTIGPCVCALIDNNSCCYINSCPIASCEYISKQCLKLSLVECFLSLSPCITQDFYDKVRIILRLKKPKLESKHHKIPSQSIYYDVFSRTKIPSKSNAKNIIQNNQKIQQLRPHYSYDTDYGSFTSIKSLSSSSTTHAFKGSGHKRDDSSDSDD